LACKNEYVQDKENISIAMFDTFQFIMFCEILKDCTKIHVSKGASFGNVVPVFWSSLVM
jgi:hypothetical protein